MRHTISTLAIAALAFPLISPRSFAAPPAPGNDADLDLVPHEVLVQLRSGARATDLTAAIPGLRIKSQSSEVSVVELVPSGSRLMRKEDARAATLRLLDQIRASPDILFAQPNYLFKLSTIPNDPLYPQQWHYPLIQMPQAWSLAGGGSSAVKIAILDTGRTSHPDLSGRWSPVEYNVTSPGSAAIDTSNWRHGTHVAGIAGAATNNATGIAGVCYNCTLLNVKITNGSSVATSNIISGLQWAVANGANVVNMSFEFSSPCTAPGMQVMRTQIEKAIDSNVTIVAAAGNQGTNVATVTPASCPGVISVAASDRNNNLASYSGRGSSLGITAPGGASFYGAGIGCPSDSQSGFDPLNFSGAVSAWTTSPATGNVHCYRHLGGTSMATPHVSGTVGLMLSASPLLTPADIRWLLQSTATPLPACGINCGPGLLNTHIAVVAACSRNILCPY
jgi:subtilisin family serine protease